MEIKTIHCHLHRRHHRRRHRRHQHPLEIPLQQTNPPFCLLQSGYIDPE